MHFGFENPNNNQRNGNTEGLSSQNALLDAVSLMSDIVEFAYFYASLPTSQQ